MKHASEPNTLRYFSRDKLKFQVAAIYVDMLICCICQRPPGSVSLLLVQQSGGMVKRYSQAQDVIVPNDD